jgi:hypothetical protein
MQSFVVGHVGGSAPSLTVALGIGAFAGLLATVLMNLPMRRLVEGSTPPFVAASALTGEPLTEVSEGLASLVHYAAGTLAGAGFILAAETIESLLLVRYVLAGTGLPLVPHLAAGGITFSVLFLFFGYVVLPLFGGEAADRAARVRNDWAISAAVYTAAVLVLIPVLTATLA